MDRLWILATCRNEAHIIPFFLRHYAAFADQILIWDDKSDDGSRELLAASPKVQLADWGHDNGLDDHWAHKFWYGKLKDCREHVQWVALVDMDEFIWAADTEEVFAKVQDYDVGRTSGFNMVGDGFPKDDGRQIWEIHPWGVKSPIYSKPILVRPDADVNWNYGRHAIEGGAARVTPEPVMKLLHYRYMGGDYTASRNGRNYERCNLNGGDKSFAWSNAPNYCGEHSAHWAEAVKADGFNVLEAPYYQ